MLRITDGSKQDELVLKRVRCVMLGGTIVAN